jgi:hypothetical protein
MDEKLKKAWENCQPIKGERYRSECFEVVKTVAGQRERYRPQTRVRVVLLAESHCSTTSEELACKVNEPDGVSCAINGDSFTRFIYCLGYGESEIVINSGNAIQTNQGTCSFWKIFAASVYDPRKRETFDLVRKSVTPDLKNVWRTSIRSSAI